QQKEEKVKQRQSKNPLCSHQASKGSRLEGLKSHPGASINSMSPRWKRSHYDLSPEEGGNKA
ncbi:mCG145183, partial [Mus musculus]